MSGRSRLFPDSLWACYGEFDFELVADGAHEHQDLLLDLREPVVVLAARSRGWDEPAEIEHFRRVFKLESLFLADGLAIVRRGDELVGMAGIVLDRTDSGASILHVGSLALLPSAQRRGILPALFTLLWEALLERPELRTDLAAGRAYLTAITQSPYIMAFLRSVSDLHPGPDRGAPEPEVVEVATRVVERFDPDVDFDPVSFVLREEADFFYRRIPYSADRRLNEFCDQRLRYDRGDTFAMVGRVRPAALSRFTEGCARAYPELVESLHRAYAGERVSGS